MKNDVVPVEIRGILPANSGCAIFVGNETKVFVIQVEHNMGAIIGMFLRDTPKERPLTHDLISHMLKGFNITVERAVITARYGLDGGQPQSIREIQHTLGLPRADLRLALGDGLAKLRGRVG